MAMDWPVRLPPGSRITTLQLAINCGAKEELGSRSLLAAIGVKGLKTTWKVSVLAFWVLGSAACEAAEIATTPARASTRAAAAPIRTTLRIIPLLAAAGAGPIPRSDSRLRQPQG